MSKNTRDIWKEFLDGRCKLDREMSQKIVSLEIRKKVTETQLVGGNILAPLLSS